jgi:hypothetical protein
LRMSEQQKGKHDRAPMTTEGIWSYA